MTLPSATEWDERPLPVVIAHIVNAYHETTRTALTELARTAKTVAVSHKREEVPRLSSLLRLMATFSDDLLAHMKKEEAILFPLIASGDGSSSFYAIQALILEHDDAVVVLDRVRSLTDSYRTPPGADVSLVAFYKALSELDTSLTRHMEIENDVLFPRALREGG